jgi:hypothetical protein
VIMKRANSNNPYFILGVGDTKLMQASDWENFKLNPI